MITEAGYHELIANCVAYNSRLSAERRMRLPFLDSHTGIAQNPSELWRSSADRQEGKDLSITYPAKRWKKKRHVIAMAPPDVRLFRPSEMSAFAEPIETAPQPNTFDRIGERSITKQILRNNTLEGSSMSNTSVKVEQTDSRDAADKDSKDTWGDEVSESEPPERDDYDDLDDEEDYEETYVKKRKKRKQAKAAGKRIAAVAAEENDKLFVCDLCNAKYKTKPGLTYHVQHTHEMPPEQPSVTQSAKSEKSADGSTPTAKGNGPLCDFCLGDVSVNKKTNRPEELVSCSDCGRAGHPSCLNFTQNQVVSTGKYGWQCIECKSCAICGTSENDDQLLFCDDCDRGYHMYCLQPPLVEPPEGSWSCDLCRNEFGSTASNPNAPHPPKEKNFPRNLVAQRSSADN